MEAKTPTPEATAKRLRWRCRRGCKELDAVLSRFVARDLDSLNADELRQLDLLLDAQDPQLSAWLVQGKTPPNPDLAAIVARILSAA